MDRRRTLVRVVWAFVVAGLTLVSVPFLSAPLTGESNSRPSKVMIATDNLIVGVPKIVEFSSTRSLIVLKPSPAQRDSVTALDAHVWDMARASKVRDADLFVYWGLSTGKFGGCRIHHYPPGDSRLTRVEEHAQWSGGYWAAGCDASYDYAGRAIKTREYSYSGFVARTRALRTPPVDLVGEDHIAVTIERH